MVQWDCRWKRQNPQMTSSRSVSVVRSSEIYSTKVDIPYNHPGCPNHWSPQSLECRHQNFLTQPKHSQTDIIFAKTPLHVPNQHHFRYRASLHFGKYSYFATRNSGPFHVLPQKTRPFVPWGQTSWRPRRSCPGSFPIEAGRSPGYQEVPRYIRWTLVLNDKNGEV